MKDYTVYLYSSGCALPNSYESETAARQAGDAVGIAQYAVFRRGVQVGYKNGAGRWVEGKHNAEV